jgi:hypothetical protein
MADTAAHLVDRVLPAAPYRQWVLTFPWRLRLALAMDKTLLRTCSESTSERFFHGRDDGAGRWESAARRAR